MIARTFYRVENRTVTLKRLKKKRGSELIYFNDLSLGYTNFVHCCADVICMAEPIFYPRVLSKGASAVRELRRKEVAGLVSMDTLDVLAELAEAEYRVPEINAQIDAQRRLIEALAFEGHDITSAQLVLDSLLMSLFLCIEERQRLRLNLNIKGAEARAA